MPRYEVYKNVADGLKFMGNYEAETKRDAVIKMATAHKLVGSAKNKIQYVAILK